MSICQKIKELNYVCYECIKWWTREKNFIKMNLNVIGQLLTTFIIVGMGPAVIAYLAYKKAL